MPGAFPIGAGEQQDEQRRSYDRQDGQRTSRTKVCGKCGGALGPQFVRALDGMFHLDCFTCNVSIASGCLFVARTNGSRTAARLSRRNSFPTQSSRRASSRCARLTTFGDWISYVMRAVRRCVGRILPRWIASIILSISRARCVRLCLAIRIATMSTRGAYTATTTTLRSLRKSATGVRLRFSSSMLRFSGMDRINIGIQSAT